MKKYQHNISTHEETRTMIHDYQKEKYIQVYIDYRIE